MPKYLNVLHQANTCGTPTPPLILTWVPSSTVRSQWAQRGGQTPSTPLRPGMCTVSNSWMTMKDCPAFPKQAWGCLHRDFRDLHTKPVLEVWGGMPFLPLGLSETFPQGWDITRGGPGWLPTAGSFFPGFKSQSGHIFFSWSFIIAFPDLTFKELLDKTL